MDAANVAALINDVIFFINLLLEIYLKSVLYGFYAIMLYAANSYSKNNRIFMRIVLVQTNAI